MCLLLWLGRYLWYLCVYYYHWVDISDIHVLITITGSISLIFMCLLLSLGRYLLYPCVYYYHWVDISDIHVLITITGSISLISMCLLLSLGRYLWYSCVYYYHWVDISDIQVFITFTGRYLCWWSNSYWRYNPLSSLIRHRHGLLDNYVFITITGAIPLLVDY
jgi:hypothetical protein